MKRNSINVQYSERLMVIQHQRSAKNYRYYQGKNYVIFKASGFFYWKQTETDRQTDRQTERERERERDG